MRFVTICVGITVFGLLFCLAGCKTPDTTMTSNSETNLSQKLSDTISMTSDDGEYEIIIIEPGFYGWLQSTARPQGFYSKSFLEARNRLLVQEYNLRVQQPMTYNPNLYEMRIDYNSNIDYGYDLNYQLYNYFIYFQLQYKQQLTSFTPRI